MEPPQPQKTRIDAASSRDYITNLPANIKENIFMKLSIKDAVRTSVLSRKRGDSWISVPKLVFCDWTGSELVKVVDTVLLHHQGPIDKFDLFNYDACNEAIGRWLLVLSRNGIKNLGLEFGFNRICMIPFCFSCTALERLCLSHCSISTPSFFQGFKHLHTLILTHCSLSEISLDGMILSCPLLDHLVLHSGSEGRLRIRSSNLTCLEIADEFYDICLETPKLASACIHLLSSPRNTQKFSAARERKESNIIHTFGRLSSIQKLEISCEFIQYLAVGPIPENLPAPIFVHLREISVCVYVRPNEISAALCLFENAPNLEELSIEFMTLDQLYVEAAWESRAIREGLFKHLKVVKVVEPLECDMSLEITKSMVEFARFVLSISPVLEKLKFVRLEDAALIFEMLKWFPKLSKNAEIAFVDKE